MQIQSSKEQVLANIRAALQTHTPVPFTQERGQLAEAIEPPYDEDLGFVFIFSGSVFSGSLTIPSRRPRRGGSSPVGLPPS